MEWRDFLRVDLIFVLADFRLNVGFWGLCFFDLGF